MRPGKDGIGGVQPTSFSFRVIGRLEFWVPSYAQNDHRGEKGKVKVAIASAMI